MNASNPLAYAPIRSLFFKYYVPALTSILSVTLHQLINGIILSHQVGKEGLAAVGLYGPVMIVFIALSLPIMIGAGILVGKSVGAENYSNTQNIFQFATTVALLSGGVVALTTPWLVKPIAYFLAGSKNTILVTTASDYMFWQLITLPLFFIRMFWGNFISNDSGPKISRNASLIAVGSNILLDLLLVIGFNLGVKGASIATAISIFVSLAYLFFYIQKGKCHFGFTKFQFTLKLNEWKQLLNLGLPSFASELSFSSGLLIINHSIVPYGALAVSAFGMINYLSFIFIRLFTSAMIATLPIMSFNIGAKLSHRVLGIFKFSFGFTILLGVIITVIGFLFPGLFISLFADNESKEFNTLARRGISLYFLLFIAAGPNYIIAAYLQSIGKSIISTIVNVLKGFVFIMILLMLLPEYLGMGLDGIWLSRSLAEILTLVVVGGYLLYYKKTFLHVKLTSIVQ
jgi:putative MATE family efflux protein